jgi:hypothetical protein
VYLVLGCAGSNAPSNRYGADSSTGRPRAKVMTQRNAISGSQRTGFTRAGADAREDAPWSAATNDRESYGYAIFDVDPGHGPGETTITFQFFAIPAVSGEPGTTTLPTAPYEKLVFGRGISAGGGEHDDRAAEPLTTTPA